MAMTTTGPSPIWTDGGTGSTMNGTAGPATWLYRMADGTYLTVGPDDTGQMREVPSLDRPLGPDGFPIPLLNGTGRWPACHRRRRPRR